MTRRYLMTVAILGLWGVLMAILGALVFNGKMEAANNANYNLAVTIHFVHVIALLSLTFMNRFVSRSNLNVIYYFFTAGIVLFAGPLYIQSTEDLTNLIIGFVGMVAPLGGLALIVGWTVVLFTRRDVQTQKKSYSKSIALFNLDCF